MALCASGAGAPPPTTLSSEAGPGGGPRLLPAPGGWGAGPPPPPAPGAPTPEPLHQVLHEPEPRLRRRVAAVQPGVDRHGQIVSLPELDRRQEMLVQRVNPAG